MTTDNLNQENKDNEIRETLMTEFDGATKGEPEEWFHRARDLGASWEFAGFIAAYNMKAEKSLPWVQFLVNVGCPKDVIWKLIEEACFEDQERTRLQNLFLADSSAWTAFNDGELRSFLMRIVKNDNAEIVQNFTQIVERLGRVPALEVVDLWLNHPGSYVAIWTDEELQVLESLPENMRKTAAKRVQPTFRTIPFIIRELKYLNRDQDMIYFHRLIKVPSSSKVPHAALQAPTALRWALLGGGRFKFPDGRLSNFENDFVAVSEGYHTLRWCVEENGWHFAKLERDGDKLIVRDNSRHGMRVVYEHDNNGPRGDRLKEGDEVMVPKDHRTKYRRNHFHNVVQLPSRTENGVTMIEMEIHPVAVPTPEMLRDPEHYFLGQDLTLLPSK